IYAVVAVAALLAAPPSLLASTEAPLRAVVHAGSLDGFEPVIQVGAAVASLGVLLSLLAGVSRTVFAMAANRHLPHALAAVHDRRAFRTGPSSSSAGSSSSSRRWPTSATRSGSARSASSSTTR